MGLWFWATVWVVALVAFLWVWHRLMSRIRELEKWSNQ